MKILHADFVTSLPAGGRLPPDSGPLIAMVGRSNVGKSSLINALLRRGLARAGAKPGTTRLVNLYAVRVVAAGRRAMRSTFADLPGYGFARGGPEARHEFETIVRGFFAQATVLVDPRRPSDPSLAGVILLVDGRHPGLDSDLAAHAWLAEQGYESIVVTTKNDRMSRSAQARARRAHEAALGRSVLPASGKTGAGVSAVRTAVGRMLNAVAAPISADGLL